MKRESKSQFWQRVEQEGRRDQARAAEAELHRQGLSCRQVQARLVAHFQPLDGTSTRAWPTPDSWKCGRHKLSPSQRYENDLDWVYKHLGSVNPDDAPTAQKRSLLMLAEHKPVDFHRRYQRALPSITTRLEAKVQARKRLAEEHQSRLRHAQFMAQQAENDRKDYEAKRKRLYRQRKREENEAAERARQRAEQQRLRHEATLAVLRERRIETKSRQGSSFPIDQATGVRVHPVYEHQEPAWPKDTDQEVIKSLEAQAWIIELEKGNKQREDTALEQAKEELPKRVAEFLERKNREATERQRRLHPPRTKKLGLCPECRQWVTVDETTWDPGLVIRHGCGVSLRMAWDGTVSQRWFENLSIDNEDDWERVT